MLRSARERSSAEEEASQQEEKESEGRGGRISARGRAAESRSCPKDIIGYFSAESHAASDTHARFLAGMNDVVDR